MKSMVSNSPAEMKIALRPFYKDSTGALETTTRTITQGSTLQDLRPLIGVGGLIGLFYELIARFNGLYNFNPSKKMIASQVEDLAAELVLDFLDRKQKPVTLEEMAIFFDRAGRNEFTNPQTAKPFIFDRIDKSVVYEIMDFYFEDKNEGRTAAVWQLDAEKEKALKKQTLQSETERMKLDSMPIDLNTWLEGRSHQTAKGLKELHEKYGKPNGDNF